MDIYDETLAYQQQKLNDTVEQAGFDLSSLAVLAASMEYDRVINDRMGIGNCTNCLRY